MELSIILKNVFAIVFTVAMVYGMNRCRYGLRILSK